jgi:hypothetical protein
MNQKFNTRNQKENPNVPYSNLREFVEHSLKLQDKCGSATVSKSKVQLPTLKPSRVKGHYSRRSHCQSVAKMILPIEHTDL